MRSPFWGCGDAIAVWGCGGSAIAKRSVGIAFGEWGCDRCFGDVGMSDSEALRRNQKIKLPHLRMARDPLNLSLHAKPVEPPPVPLELYKKSNSP